MRKLAVIATATLLAGGAGSMPATAAAKSKKKTGCQALKTKKQQASCKRLRASGKYRKGMVCALTKKKQAEYMRAGYFCLDISADQNGGLTYLEVLGR